MEKIKNLHTQIKNSRIVKDVNFRTKLKSRGSKTIWGIVCFLILFGLSFIVVYPLIFSISMSIRDVRDVTDPSVMWVPKNFTFFNIKETVRLMKYGTTFLNSVKLCMGSSLLQVISCAIVGYGFARFKFKFKGLFFALALFTIIVPPQVVYIPTFLFYRDLNILDSVLAMYIPAFFGVGIRSGLFIYIFRQFYRNLPKELEDAAYVDGCGYYMTFIRLVIPNAKTVITTVFLFSMVWYWGDYYYTKMYFTNFQTVTTSLSNLSFAISQYGDTATYGGSAYTISLLNQSGCLLAVLPMLILYIVFQRKFVDGLERSGIIS